LKTDTDQPVLGKFLNGRYKTIQVLSAGAFGHTYITEDTWLDDSYQCVVKHLKLKDHHPERSQICKRQFTNEVLILNQLGNHYQIPQLLDCFEDDRGFYLVQELIEGEPLNAKLPLGQHWGKPWTEVQCVELLQDVLGILEFVHSQGFIHGDLKPSNLIQRSSDGRFVLIDFGCAQTIKPSQVKPRVIPIKPSIAPVGIPAVGYIPTEQLRGQPCPSSDIYALGMIAIQALTGLNPMELEAEPDSGEVNWQQHALVSDSMASVLNQMVRYDVKDRYQSATDVRIALKRLLMRSEEQGVSEKESSDRLIEESPIVVQPLTIAIDTEELQQCLHTVSRLPQSNNGEKQTLGDSDVLLLPANCLSESQVTKGYYARELALACLPKLPPLLAGMGAGMTTSSGVVISLGLYTLLHAAPSNPGLDLLERATQQYKEGNFDEAIALTDLIPTDSSAYKDSIIAKRKWRKEWDLADRQFKAVQEAFNEQRWRDVLEEAHNTPNIDYWQLKIAPFVEQAKPELEAEAQQLLQQAYNQAAQKDFTGALALLKQISKETPTGAEIQPKLMEYSQKQQIKAESLLQQAYHRAAKKDFSGALKYLVEIPEDTPAYQTAQIKMVEYSQKQDFNEETHRQAELNARFPKEEIEITKLAKSPKISKPSNSPKTSKSSNSPKTSKPSNSPKTSESSKDLNPGSDLKEVTPEPVRYTPARR